MLIEYPENAITSYLFSKAASFSSVDTDQSSAEFLFQLRNVFIEASKNIF